MMVAGTGENGGQGEMVVEKERRGEGKYGVMVNFVCQLDWTMVPS